MNEPTIAFLDSEGEVLWDYNSLAIPSVGDLVTINQHDGLVLELVVVDVEHCYGPASRQCAGYWVNVHVEGRD